ncbi:hypothetical protein SNEBB_004869 [Seison nebaliae]|nr:hypothetical protein SNEBB_004869 [Seison nebaliae]
MKLISGSIGLFRKINTVRHSSSFFVQQPNERKIQAMKKIPHTKYGGKYTITIIPGDGIGPEMIGWAKEAFRLVRAPVIFEDVELDSTTCNNENMMYAIKSVQRNGLALKGNITSDHDKLGYDMSANVRLRTELELYANVLRCKSIKAVNTKHDNIDIFLIRENTEGEYSGMEHEPVKGIVESLKVITTKNSLRIAEYAFQLASVQQRRKVTAVHKANIMKKGDGLFIECCAEVAKRYPDIEFNTMIVDNTCMQLVSKPEQFDVMLMPNLYGNIVANIATGMVGGSGIVAGRNIGDHCAVFETGTRNTGVSLKGKNIANPSSMLFSAADLLEYLGCRKHSSTIRHGILHTIREKNIRTQDIGGTASTSEFMNEVLSHIMTLTPEFGFLDKESSGLHTFN